MKRLQRMKMNSQENRSHQSGVGLIEVLIAVLLLSFAVLGASSMIIRAENNSNSAYYRAIATDIAMELSERMYSNLPALEDNDGNDTTIGGSYVTTTESNCVVPPTAYCSISTTTVSANVADCTPAQMAIFDMWQLRCANGINHLPGGTLSVQCIYDTTDTGLTNNCAMRRIYVQWQASGDALPSRVVMPFKPAPIG
ncbi:type IV pilus modification protein PilV [Solemya velum gill symbiont]|nr:type IV pilus modification protein PilV [Solemya velum gill symbiont]